MLLVTEVYGLYALAVLTWFSWSRPPARARLRLMEWCYVVCSHERLRGHRPGLPTPEADAIVISLDDYREPARVPVRPSMPALRQA